MKNPGRSTGIQNMNMQPRQRREIQDRLSRYAPYATIFVLLVVSYFALFHSGVGFTNSANAQVNLGRVGEAAAETATGAASEHAADIAEVEGGLETPVDEGVEPDTDEPIPAGDAPAESVEIISDGRYMPDTGPGTIWFTDPTGIDGTRIYDLTPQEMFDSLLALEDLQGSVEAATSMMPILLRFQTMVSPPMESWVEDEEPWVSGERRYSPFDPVGMGDPTPTRRYEPVPPFQNPLPGLVQTDHTADMINAQSVAASLSLIGVFGDVGDYRAIISAGEYEKTVGVGEELITISQKTYIVEEITLLNIKIVNVDRPDDTALISFIDQERSGISELSFSY